ncbi:MAG: ferredoxin--NADP(+) reductase [Spirochaetales bacterium]|nr:ferredoxin--NADP(+) reductase [Spirochaetales bacterium]
MELLARPDPPLNTYKPTNPLRVRFVKKERLTTPDALDDIYHLVFDLEGQPYSFVEGQSMGVVAPGERAPGKPHQVRLYSIASTSSGEAGNPDHIALCVKRATHTEADGQVGQGVCSGYLCHLSPGDPVLVTGPSGKAFVLPEDKAADMILIATGTGIAPFRAFLMRMLGDLQWAGKIDLFYGAKTQRELSYANDCNAEILNFQDRIGLHLALSRVDPHRKIYVQDRLLEEGQRIRQAVERGQAAFYICGLKGMEAGIEESLSRIMEGSEHPWAEWKARLKKSGRWNLEVY